MSKTLTIIADNLRNAYEKGCSQARDFARNLFPDFDFDPKPQSQWPDGYQKYGAFRMSGYLGTFVNKELAGIPSLVRWGYTDIECPLGYLYAPGTNGNHTLWCQDIPHWVLKRDFIIHPN